MKPIIRNYKPEDARDIGKFNHMFQLSYQYNEDVISSNIFCAEVDNQVVASGHLEPTDTCEYLNREFYRYRRSRR